MSEPEDAVRRRIDLLVRRGRGRLVADLVGRLGGARAQYHLRQCFVFLNAHVLNRPEVMIGGVREAFDAGGQLVDEKARDMVARQLEALRDFARR